MDVFSQIRPVSLREQVVIQIRTAIIEGRLRPGDHITEITLTKQLGVSRTPVREALILLEREGLVISSPNRGCFVRIFSEDDVHHLFAMRTTLENFAGELIIDRLTEADFEHLSRSIEAQRLSSAEGDLKRVRTIDMDFHRYLIEKSENPLLIRSWSELVAQVAAVLYIRAEAQPDYDEMMAIRDHHTIVEAYTSRNLEGLKMLNQRINGRVADECRAALQKLHTRRY
jgi:DNA-binding GntR family transcriptional regulator